MSLKRKKKVAAQDPEPDKITFTVGYPNAVFTIDIGNGLTLKVEMSREKANRLGQALIHETFQSPRTARGTLGMFGTYGLDQSFYDRLMGR